MFPEYNFPASIIINLVTNCIANQMSRKNETSSTAASFMEFVGLFSMRNLTNVLNLLHPPNAQC